MALKVDATDVARGIFHVHQTIPVEKAGTLTLLYPEWLPGKHAPRGAISGLTGFQASAGGMALRWTRQPTDVHAFDIDVPEGAQIIDVAFDFLAPTRTSEGRIVLNPARIGSVSCRERRWPSVVVWAVAGSLKQKGKNT